jgi:hypothetical protein
MATESRQVDPAETFSIIMVESVGACNGSCPYCPRGCGLVSNEDCQPITASVLDKALTLAKQGTAKALYLHHRGEPFLHPHLEDVVRAVRRAGFYAYLSTNLIEATADRVARVFRAGLNQMEIHYRAGLGALTHSELLHRIHAIRKLNWAITNNGCRIEVNYGLFEEEEGDVRRAMERESHFDETMYIRFYVPHDWPRLIRGEDRGINFRDCEWFKRRCCAVLSNGDIVICCLDQLRHSCVANVADVETIAWAEMHKRSLCKSCVQQCWDMDWLSEDALAVPGWLTRGNARRTVGDDQQ